MARARSVGSLSPEEVSLKGNQEKRRKGHFSMSGSTKTLTAVEKGNKQEINRTVINFVIKAINITMIMAILLCCH